MTDVVCHACDGIASRCKKPQKRAQSHRKPLPQRSDQTGLDQIKPDQIGRGQIMKDQISQSQTTLENRALEDSKRAAASRHAPHPRQSPKISQAKRIHTRMRPPSGKAIGGQVLRN